jgi:nucleoside 2-deoxyribosyltransferase
MPFKVFLSYGMDQEAQVTAWRLQTLGTSHGIHVFVPQRNGPHFPSSGRGKVAAAAVQQAINESDCVLAIVTGRSGPSVETELNYALQKRKLIIPIVQKGAVSESFLARFPQVFEFSPWQDPGKLESAVMEFLKRQKLDKEKRQAIGALILVGLGLFLLAASEK